MIDEKEMSSQLFYLHLLSLNGVACFAREILIYDVNRHFPTESLSTIID
jgi:hypothetical protein